LQPVLLAGPLEIGPDSCWMSALVRCQPPLRRESTVSAQLSRQPEAAD
jgi:hypothetical protein